MSEATSPVEATKQVLNRQLTGLAKPSPEVLAQEIIGHLLECGFEIVQGGALAQLSEMEREGWVVLAVPADVASEVVGEVATIEAAMALSRRIKHALKLAEVATVITREDAKLILSWYATCDGEGYTDAADMDLKDRIERNWEVTYP